MTTKTVLLVYAHQSAGSFNAAVKTAAVDELKKQGCRVLVSDLYEVKFKATATEDDITGAVKNPEHFCYGNETMLAWQEARLASDIVDEHKKLKEADLVIFQDKKAMLSFTTGSHETMFSSNGINGDMNVTLWPIQNGVLNYCGFQVLAPQIFWAPTHLSPEAPAGPLGGRRPPPSNEAPLAFPPADIFDKGKGFQLKPEVREKQADSPFGLTVGHHLEKPLPPQSQMKAGV
uniref:Ribosyldihydronicotinamide dehydrogenase [quinone]-like n=1 Tax=Sinocyclocheilus grahami TaxID=75366 RepID=A0A672Q0F2_SINGR